MQIIKSNKARLAFAGMATVGLAACANTQQINQESAAAYRQMITQTQQQGNLDNRSATAQRVKRVFDIMLPYARALNETGVPFAWEINVIRSQDMNAFAMPGGKMVFFTGLVDKLRLNDAEIATIMGHEMAHALREHGKARYNQQQLGNIGVVLADIGLQAAGINTGVNQELLSITKAFALDLPYSRSNENEADAVGLMLMATAGYDPRNAPNLWHKFASTRGNKSQNSLLGNLASTHPTDEERFAHMNQLMPKALELYQAARTKR